MKITLPLFPGFYNTHLDYLMYSEMEQRTEPGEGEPERNADEVLNEYNCSVARTAICKAWVHALNGELGTNFEFADLWSPREYNFNTDQLSVNLSPGDVEKLQTFHDSAELRGIVMEELKPRDGFAPFYSDDPQDEEWTRPIDQWEPAQLPLLIQALILSELGIDNSSELSDLLLGGRFDYTFTEAAAQG